MITQHQPRSPEPLEDLRAEVGALLAAIRWQPWRADALCKEYRHLPWIDERASRAERAAMLQVCGRCLVLSECRSWALADEQRDLTGVAGGLDAPARRGARRLASRQRGSDASR